MTIFIRITDDDLAARLEALRLRQPARLAMTALGEAILRNVVRACESDPQAWEKIGNSNAAAPTTQQPNNASTSKQIHDVPTTAPAQQGSDREVNDPASTTESTAGPVEPRSDASPDEARRRQAS